MIYVSNPLVPLEHLLRHFLNWLHGSVGLPWAWSIVALTVIVRMVLVPLTVRQIHSMQALQVHAPQMKEIQKKYKDDKQRQQEELMKFYRENKINPAASCLPMLAQLPVFFGLYYTLRHFAREPARLHPGSLSWLGIVPSIADHVTAHWSGYLLLAIYVLSQVASSYFMATTADKTQRILLMVMPFLFVFFIAHFPTGLVLYWMTTNLWTVGQGLITRQLMPKKGEAPAPAKRPAKPPPGDDGDAGNGAAKPPPKPKPAPSAQTPRPVRRKKKAKR